jgi:tetratricopeptide (TPR) repeat protein
VTKLSAFAEVQAALERGQFDEVIARTGEMLATRPGDDAAHELRARALLALGRLDEAAREVADAVRLDPDEVRYRELLAQVLAARGAHRDAAVEFGTLARDDPRQGDWTVAEARQRLDAAQPEMSVDAARRAVRLDGDDFAAQLALARGLVRTGDARGALDAALRAARLHPGDPEAREALADARWLAGDARAALGAFAALAGDLPRNERGRVLRKALVLYRQRATGAGRILAALPPFFAFALRHGWVQVP